MIYYKKLIYLFVLTISLNIESNTNIEYSIEMIFIEYEDVLIDDERFNEVFDNPDESIINIKSKDIRLNKKAFLIENKSDPLKNNQLDVLETIYKNLKYRKGVKAIDKVSWKQPITSYEDAKYAYYQNSKIGTYIKFYESRYLHADIKSFIGDLSNSSIEIDKNNYINNIAPDISENVVKQELPKIEVTYFEENSYINNEQVEITNTSKNDEIIYYIDENMRLFDKNIYFLDHPKFGIFMSLKKTNS